MPVGAIAMWSSLNGAIPADWAECDGVANAPGPDLRNFFIVGRGTKTVDTTGGGATHVHSDSHTHAGTAVGAHSNHVFTQPSGHSAHVVTQPSAHSDHANNIAHTHNIGHVRDATTGGATTNIAKTVDATSTLGTSTPTDSSGSGASLAHSAHAGTAVDAHSAHTGGAVDAHSAHSVTDPSAHPSHTATNHEPTWYAIIFIQRMS